MISSRGDKHLPIKDIIKIQGGYSAQVKLKQEFENREENTDRMTHYKPIKSHRRAFELMAEGIYKKDSKRCFVLSGSYGTGKSHLCLMIANYLESSSETPEMVEFFNNYAEAEDDSKDKKADILKNVRKNGRYLVAICNFELNTHFETIVLRAVKEALEREQISPDEIDSNYLQALKKITEWEKSDNQYFYQQMKNEIERHYPAWTIKKIKKSLSDYDRDAIEVFKAIHKTITTADFEYEKDSMVEIIKQISQSKIIKDHYAGITVIFDEFDYQMKNKRFNLNTFHSFAEMCESSFLKKFPVVFIATTHRSFVSYKSVFNAEDFATVNDRVKEIELKTEGIEDIISAIVIPQKSSPEWQDQIQPRISIFNQLAAQCNNAKIFNWLPGPKLRLKIIENIYPMHPMTTYSLLNLASDVGSNNRSVFTFFADQKGDPGSYDWFVNNYEILNQYGELQFFTVDLLFDYFANKITSDNAELRSVIKEFVRDYETSLRELNKLRINPDNFDVFDDIYDRILRIMVVYQIIGTPVNEDNLLFGLNYNVQEKVKELKYCLKHASARKIIFLNESNNCYEFRKSDAADVGSLIREYKEIPNNIPQDFMAEIEILQKHHDVKKLPKFFKQEDYLKAIDYNVAFNEDKRLKRVFASVADVEGANYFDLLTKELFDSKNVKSSCEGIALYVICNTEDDLRRARKVAENNDSDHIIVAIPSEEIPVIDELFSLKAAVSINTEDFSLQDSGILKEYIKDYDAKLETKLNKYINAKNLICYGQNGVILSQNSGNNYEAVSKMMETIFETKRNRIKHEELNYSHEFKVNKNTSLKEAVENLLDFSKDVSFNNHLAADHGDRRYIHNVLFNTGVLIPLTTQNNRTVTQIEIDPQKYVALLPALSDMINVVKSASQEINLISIIDRYILDYGLGYNAVILFFAVTLRYFRDNIMIIPDVNEIGSIRVVSYDNVLDLLYHRKHKNAVIRYKEISDSEKQFIKQLYGIFNTQLITNHGEISIEDVHGLIKNWYVGLPAIAKVKDIYEGSRIGMFIDIFNKSDKRNSHDFILGDIKTVYGFEMDDLILAEKAKLIIDGFKEDKELLERGYDIVRDDIISRIKELFGIQSVTYEDIINELNNWYKGLSELQRNPNNDLHSDLSKPLVRLIGKETSLEELFMSKLPSNQGYNLGVVTNWIVDKRNSFVENIRHGKQYIEEQVFLVNMPDYQFVGDVINSLDNNSETVVLYQGEIKVIIKPDPLHKKIFITSNGEDPAKQTSQREEKSSEYVLVVTDNKKVRFLAEDFDGRSSKIVNLKLENEDLKYHAKYIKTKPKQMSIGEVVAPDEYKIEVALPKDRQSLKTCIQSLLKLAKDRFAISDDDVCLALQELLDEK